MMQLMRMMNRLLDKAPETRRRNLSFHTPVIVPIWPQARTPQAALRFSQADHSSSVVVTGYGTVENFVDSNGCSCFV